MARVLRGPALRSQWPTLVDALLGYASETPLAPAVVDTIGGAYTYEGLLRASLAAARLLAEKGAGPGAPVALAPVNTVEHVAALLGTWLAGAAAVVMDAAGPWEELVFQLERLGAKPAALVVDEELAGRHCPAAERLGVPCLPAQELARGSGWWEGYARPRPHEDALIYFYAGVAGRTLPVIHSHAGVAASAAATAQHYGLGPADASFVSPPISHALGLQVATLSMLSVGGRTVLYTKKGRLDPGHAAAAMAASRATVAWGAPGFYQAVLRASYRGHPGLRAAVSAGAPMPPGLQREWLEATGVELLQLYGMTEAAPLTATLPGANPEGSIGFPMPGVELRLLGEEGRGEASRGEAAARGPMVMRGYGDPRETAAAMLPGGWLRTGDILEERGGFLYFRGVRKRMLKYKGYPVFPRDLEELLERHPAVARAEVYGLETEHGLAPAARLWLRRGAEVSPEEIMEWVNRMLPGYKRLRRVEVVGYS